MMTEDEFKRAVERVMAGLPPEESCPCCGYGACWDDFMSPQERREAIARILSLAFPS